VGNTTTMKVWDVDHGLSVWLRTPNLSDPLDRFPISLRHVEPPPFIDHRGDERFVGHFGPTGVFSRA
jgi:hypothetical protein